MSTLDYEDGHEPTGTDESNAMYYASMNQKYNICLSDPVNYTWKEDPVLAYPCPEGLTCHSGKCEFSKQGCYNYSTLPYFDCKRKTVPCNFGNGQETCEMCDWTIVPSTITGLPCPAENNPPLNDADKTLLGDQAVYCQPGDMKVNPVDDSNPTKDLCRATQSKPCPGLPMNLLTPYLVNNEKVNCNCDDNCNTNGAGGKCMVPSTTDGGAPTPIPSTNTCDMDPPDGATAYCYPPDGVYTEWRTGFTMFDGAPQEDACVQTFASAKQWCEMPWGRPTVAGDDGLANPSCWKTQNKQPFYYRPDDGKCYITKSYCENNVGAGGFDSDFGDGTQYWILSNCTTPNGDSNEVQVGYDCCTDLGQSLAQFYFGKTIPAEFDNLTAVVTNALNGTPSPECNSAAPKVSTTDSVTPGISSTLQSLVSFLSDERLKENIVLVEENACGMGIHSYDYTWNNIAKRIYNKPEGVMRGLLIKDLEKVFPESIRTSPYGHKVFAHIPEIMPKFPDIKSIVYLCTIATLMQTSDIETPII